MDSHGRTLHYDTDAAPESACKCPSSPCSPSFSVLSPASPAPPSARIPGSATASRGPSSPAPGEPSEAPLSPISCSPCSSVAGSAPACSATGASPAPSAPPSATASSPGPTPCAAAADGSVAARVAFATAAFVDESFFPASYPTRHPASQTSFSSWRRRIASTNPRIFWATSGGGTPSGGSISLSSASSPASSRDQGLGVGSGWVACAWSSPSAASFLVRVHTVAQGEHIFACLSTQAATSTAILSFVVLSCTARKHTGRPIILSQTPVTLGLSQSKVDLYRSQVDLGTHDDLLMSAPRTIAAGLSPEHGSWPSWKCFTASHVS
mmetsp:Transcript_1915/g.4311  ORF Transcript_1915/g.4311 Transcript_1915/m.4311 type:complete len:324 (+) Transcript_1915:12-983(+)